MLLARRTIFCPFCIALYRGLTTLSALPGALVNLLVQAVKVVKKIIRPGMVYALECFGQEWVIQRRFFQGMHLGR